LDYHWANKDIGPSGNTMTILDLTYEVGLTPKKVSSTQGGEYKSACPRCGGKDRFFIQPHKRMKNCSGYYRCRQCDCNGDTIQFAMDFLGLDFKSAAERSKATIPEKKTFFMNHISRKNTFTPAKINATNQLWQSKANAFIAWAHQQILNQSHILQALEKRGLSPDAIRTYKIGWNPNEVWRDRHTWGLEQQDESEKKLWLPQGIVIPSLEKNGDVQRIKIRRTAWQDSDTIGKYIAIPGSMNGLTIIGDKRNEIMIVVESELDAYAIHYAMSDFVCVIAVGSNTKNPDNITDHLAKTKKHLLICHDNDDAGIVMLNKWKQLYVHAKGYPTSIGKDIGEAVEQGFQIRSWILQHGWIGSLDQELINWALQYINHRTITRHAYINLEKEIALGSISSRAKTGELQHGLKFMEELIQQNKQ
jgi:DNA primase